MGAVLILRPSNSLRAPAAALLLAGLAATAAPASGQSARYDLSLRDVPVEAALEDLAGLTGISLVYDSGVVEGRRTVCRREAAAAEELLRCIVQGAGLDFYRLSSGTYVVIEGAEALPAYGTISGQIVDGVTGDPVPDAWVGLADGTGGTTTNGAGMFLLARLLPGPHQLLVSQAGYDARSVLLDVLSSGNTRQRIRLDPTVLELDPIVVEGIRDIGGGSPGGSRWRGEGFEGGIPLDGELSQQARTGLGVARRPLFADLSIQGSAPGEHMVRLDRVPVFDPVSLGRSRSAFSPLALRRITVRKAGFGVEHGSFTGGVIDVEHALTDRGTDAAATTLADPYSVNGDVAVPLSLLGGSGSLMVAGRSSLWSVYREPSLDRALRDWNQMDPVLMGELASPANPYDQTPSYTAHDRGSSLSFSDVHAAMRLEFPGFRTVQASFYRGTNNVSTELLTSDSGGYGESPLQLILTRDGYAWSNTAGQLRTDWLIGDRTSMQLRFWGSRHELDHGYRMAAVPSSAGGLTPETSEVEADLRSQLTLQPPADDGNRIQEWGTSVTADLAVGSGHFLTGGVEALRLQSRAHLENGFLRPLLFQELQWRWAAFLQDRWRITNRFSLEGGVRVTSMSGGSGHFEPRLAARFDGSNRLLGPWSLRVSGGVFRQYLNQFSLSNLGPSALVPEVQFWLPVDGTMEPSRSRHLAVEFGARPWSGWEVGAEAYLKSMDRILALDYGALTAYHTGLVEMDQADFVGPAEGTAYGVGGRIAWEQGRARARLSYDWTVSERTFPSRFQGERQPTPWSEPHRLTAQGRVPVWGGLAVDVESRNVWGRTWGLRRAYYDYLPLRTADDDLPVGLPEDDPLPTLHQLDVGLSWLGEVEGVLAELRAEVRNAQGTRQVLDYSLQPRTDSDGETEYLRRARVLPGPALLVSVRLGF